MKMAFKITTDMLLELNESEPLGAAVAQYLDKATDEDIELMLQELFTSLARKFNGWGNEGATSIAMAFHPGGPTTIADLKIT